MTVHTLFVAAAGFEAARQLDVPTPTHRSGRLHGHGFRADVRCALPAGWAAFVGGEVAALRDRLEATLAPLDYRLLNERIANPTDDNIARWLRSQLDAPGLKQVGVQSTGQQGVVLDAAGQVQLWRRYAFQAAHRLPRVPVEHKCGRMHGHGFEVIVQARQETGGTPLDYDALDRCWAPWRQLLDHACLNELPGLHNPTSEVLASWLWERLQPALPTLSRVTVFETASCGAHFDGAQYRIWKDFSFDSARRLRHAPGGSPLRRLHGHTYTLRLHLGAALDQMMGWLVDFGDVKTLFEPVFQLLDHQPLHESGVLAECDTASLARWTFDQGRARLPQLSAVELHETRGCGVLVALAPHTT